MEEDERVEAITKAAAGVFAEYPYRKARLNHRFDRWGYGASIILLEQLEKIGFTVCKKEGDAQDV